MAVTKFSAIEPEAEPERVKPGSDRSLGFVFATAFSVLGAWPLIHARSPRVWFLLSACLFAFAAIYAPRILRPLNVVWTRLGALLHRETTRRLKEIGARLRVLPERELLDHTARALADQKAIGWMQGRMEFGPRALGNRSILGDPRSPSMQKMLNLKVKYRESFRPFAPSVLREDVSQWFDLEEDSPYMLLVAPMQARHRRDMTDDEKALFGIDKLNVPRSSIPAVTHVDYSARVQTVHANTNPRFHALISRFKELTGCGVLVNTSFNVRGEPIVCTPEDAFRCFMGTEMDTLVIGNAVLRKDEQPQPLAEDYKNRFEGD